MGFIISIIVKEHDPPLRYVWMIFIRFQIWILYTDMSDGDYNKNES